jgi:glycerol uptake facilitator-like aquaporin
VGTALLVAVVVGSGIMAETLSPRNDGVALLANTFATCAGLYALITALGPASGAHLNPAVTLVLAALRDLRPLAAAVYIAAQLAGGVLGTLAAHAMFSEPLLQVSTKPRPGLALGFAELVATAGLLLVVLSCRARSLSAAWPVAAWIGAAYWFTASTSFANPAVTIARSLSDTFAGIAPSDLPTFIVAQLAGAATGGLLAARLVPAPVAPE